MIFELTQQFTIESARYLPFLPPEHPCSRMHGHSFKIELVLRGELKKSTGWLVDYNDIKKIAAPIITLLDHQELNKIAGLENPTTENITHWLYQKVKAQLPELYQVVVSETKDTSCRYPVL